MRRRNGKLRSSAVVLVAVLISVFCMGLFYQGRFVGYDQRPVFQEIEIPQVTATPVVTPEPSPTPEPTSKPTATPAPTTRPLTDFEKYNNMSEEKQLEFFNSFSDPMDFFAWYEKAQAEYEAQQDAIIVGGDTVIDMGEIFK